MSEIMRGVDCVTRWRENRPLSRGELNQMRFQAIVRCVLAIAVLAWVALALCGCATLQAQVQGKFPSAEADTEPTFDGVTIVVCVKELTGFAPELRRKAALDADRVLRELAERKLPGKVRTRLIAEVAEPYAFRNFEAASMVSAKPVLVHVLIPVTNQRLTVALVLKKVEELATSHFLEDLQQYQVMVTFQRTQPERYQVGVMAATLQDPPREERPTTLSAPDPVSVPLPPEPSRSDLPDSGNHSGLMVTMISAWLTERSRLAAKLLAGYQRLRGPAA